MDSKSDSIEIMICDKAGEVIEECFEKALFRYQVGLETSMKDSDFICDWVNFFYYYHIYWFSRLDGKQKKQE